MIEYIAAAIIVAAILLWINWGYFTEKAYVCKKCGDHSDLPRQICFKCQSDMRKEDWEYKEFNPIQRLFG